MYYSVNLLYKSERAGSNPSLWEERIILVSAADESEAEEIALRRVKEHECTYVNVNSEHHLRISRS